MLAGRERQRTFAFHKTDSGIKMDFTGYGIGRVERNFSAQTVGESGIVTVLDQCHAAEVRGVEYGKQA